MRGAFDLVLIDVQPGDVAAGELDHLAGGASHTAADVEDLHVGLDIYVVGQEMLVASYGTRECLAVRESTEVKALAPTVLV